MRAILQEYLSFSRPFEELRPEPLSLGDLSEEVLSVLEARAAAEGIQLRRRGDARIEADPRRLREALFNLVANAIEATPRGGEVEVEVAERDGAASVAVRDSGRGMPREVLDRIGTAFFTTRPQGTGLGVVLARAAFSQHGGSLHYESAPERGTVVTGTLPLRRSDVASLAG
jgi:signal transduction histidine kinase